MPVPSGTNPKYASDPLHLFFLNSGKIFTGELLVFIPFFQIPCRGSDTKLVLKRSRMTGHFAGPALFRSEHLPM
jgi:hypothetical protein